MADAHHPAPPPADRARWMGLAARAEPARLAALLDALGPLPAHEAARPAQPGLVMARGRIGAVGRAFNLGEVSATRCAVRLADGTVGVAYVLGRDRAHAERAALLDALMQGARAAEAEARVLGPLAREEAARREARARKAEATRVEFFTLARGEP
jgi:alpha-D-ribose 1-methylphosphonate 5-triphosphate synthase subunit PhnG